MSTVTAHEQCPSTLVALTPLALPPLHGLWSPVVTYPGCAVLPFHLCPSKWEGVVIVPAP